MAAIHIRKKDTVLVMTGRDKGKKGEVLKVVKDQSGSPAKAQVAKVNIVTFFQRPTQTEPGGIHKKEGLIAISNFKLRQGMPIGVRVTLRGDRMYEFLDRLISISIPRLRDFRGLESRGFDGYGNYNLGLQEQHIFPEINIEKSTKARGMNISFVPSVRQLHKLEEDRRDAAGMELLERMGMPFRKRQPAAKETAAPAARS